MAQVRYERLSTDISHSNEELELRVNHYNTECNHDSDTPKTTDANENSYMQETTIHQNSMPNARIPRSHLMYMASFTLLTVFIYLVLSITMVFFHRNMIQKYGFPFTIVCYHLVIKFALAYSLRFIYKCYTGKARVLLDFRTSLKKMAPTGFASGIDIGFSSLGFQTVTVALYTMTKSSSIVFILFFAILLGLERKSTLLIFTVSLIAVGLFMFTYKSTQFNEWGFMCILFASFSSGIRWSLAQFLMQKTKLGLHNPVDMIFHMQPWMFASLLPFVAFREAKNLYKVLIVDLPNTDSSTVYLIIFNITSVAVLAFFMEVSEFLVLSKTSGLTLSIAGIFKDVCQVVIAVEMHDENITFLKVSGMLVCLAGISCHLFHKYTVFYRMVDKEAIVGDGGDGSLYNEDPNASIPNGSAAAQHQYRQTDRVSVAATKKNSTLTVPLLEQADSNESSDDSDGPNASDVIFDVLKRRDISR